MCIHYELLLRWAVRVNLTSVLDPVRAAGLHGIDSLLFAECLTGAVGASRAAVDVGSGGGFPGIPVALVHPEFQMTLLEPRRKRASFLRVVLRTIKRTDVRVVEGRLEGSEVRTKEAVASEGLWPSDVILSRATMPPQIWIDRLAPRLRPGGVALVSSGAQGPDPGEVKRWAEDARLSYRDRLSWTLPGGEMRRIDRLGAPAV